MIYQVDNEDANFLFMDRTDSPTHISLLVLYDPSDREGGNIRFRHILQRVGNRLSTAPVFRQKIRRVPGDIDYPYWVDDDKFDLDYHVRHLALPKPGDWRQFCIQVARLHSRPLDLSRPLWELYVIEGLDHVDELPPGSFAIYFKIHHCAVDEFTALELLESLHGTEADTRPPAGDLAPVAHLPATAPPTIQMLMMATVNNTLHGARLLRQVIANARWVSSQTARLGVRLLRKYVAGETLTDVPVTRFGGRLGSARVFAGELFPHDVMDMALAQVPGATASHVLMLVCGEALRLFLERQDGQFDVPLRALKQIDLRNAGAHALVGNHIAVEQMDLFTGIDHLVERLHAIVGGNGDLENAPEFERRGMQMRALYENLPAPLLAYLGRRSNRRNSLSRKFMHSGNFGFAELNGPEQTLYLLGARLHAFASISPLYSGCGLMFSASHFEGRTMLSFTADRNMLPEPKRLQQCVDEAVTRLRKQLGRDKGRRAGKASVRRTGRLRVAAADCETST